jgi:hypothetical protein
MKRMQEELEQWLGRLGMNDPRRFAHRVYPPLNLWEDDNNLYVEVELPELELTDLENRVRSQSHAADAQTSENRLCLKPEPKSTKAIDIAQGSQIATRKLVPVVPGRPCEQTTGHLRLSQVPFLERAMNMRNDTELSDAGRQYAAAYAAHYTRHDLPGALQLYRAVMASHPDAQEAGYSRAQVQNIANAVVPKQELLDAQMGLALAHLENDGAPATGRSRVSLHGTELSK